MHTRQTAIAILVWIVSLVISSCGSAQPFGPTPTPTSTPTPTPIPGPRPGHWEGAQPYVSFDITADGNIINFALTVPLSTTALSCEWRFETIPVVDDQFLVDEAELVTIAGKFDHTTVAGTHRITFCGNTRTYNPQEEPWTAEWIGPIQPTAAAVQLPTATLPLPTPTAIATPTEIATPTTNAPALSPSATLLINSLIDKCQWVVRMSLRNFAPNSVITVSSSYTELECASGKTVQSKWTEPYSPKTDSNGKLIVSYIHEGTGTYEYTFTDEEGNSATLLLNTIP